MLLGYPAIKMESHVEIQKALRRLPRLAKRVGDLEKAVAERLPDAGSADGGVT